MDNIQETERDLQTITAKNIALLRTARHMTQLELGEALRYSDKAISKWERGAAIPDAYVLKQMSALFGVSVDYLLTPHEGEVAPVPDPVKRQNRPIIAILSAAGVWALATLLFLLSFAGESPMWQLFIYTLPVSLVVLLVFNSIWGRRRENFWLISALVMSILLAIYIALLSYHFWQIFVLAAPAELIVFLCFRLKK